MSPHVNLDTQEITDRTRRELLRLLESVPGKKNLVVQKSLLGPIGLFTKFSTLQEYGVEKLFVVENKNVETAQKNIVILARGEKPKEVQAVADLIKQIRKESQHDHDFTIIWSPRRTRLSDSILEENGVLGEANILQCPLYLIALEPDVLSLELEDATADLYQRHDPTALFMSAQALMAIQRRCGLIPRILGKGDHAQRLADLLVRLRAEEEITHPESASDGFLSSFGSVPSAAIDSLVIIDRDIDFPSALSTQLTYAGLLDEQFSIRFNTIEVPTSIVGAGPSSNAAQQSQQNQTQSNNTGQKRKIALDSSDPLYPDLRDLNFAVLGPTLNARARALQSNYEARHKADASISDLKSFVSKLPSYQAEQASLKLHTSLAEEILSITSSDLFSKTLEVQQTLIATGDASQTSMHERIEDLISRAAPLPSVLRLLCLSSTLTGGLRPRDLDAFKLAICHAYGFAHLLTLARLEAAGLLTQRTPSNTAYLNPMAASGRARQATDYGWVRKGFRLLVDDVDEDARSDVAYVFSGYAPLSVRVVQCALAKDTLYPGAHGQLGWKPFEDALGRIRGPTVDVVQAGSKAGVGEARSTLKGQGADRDGRTVTSVVFFVGGVTYAEIAAIRLVAKGLRERRGGANRRIVIATTGIISGDRLVGGAIEAGKL